MKSGVRPSFRFGSHPVALLGGQDLENILQFGTKANRGTRVQWDTWTFFCSTFNSGEAFSQIIRKSAFKDHKGVVTQLRILVWFLFYFFFPPSCSVYWGLLIRMNGVLGALPLSVSIQLFIFNLVHSTSICH